MDYKEIINDLKASDKAKDKELIGIFRANQRKKVFLLGNADDPFQLFTRWNSNATV